jgi:type II secretory pathway pseudopilin PulG
MKLRCRHNAAFTMIEIAIAIGVIAFALIAIIGVLPTGMQVQRDNRQDTIINQDGAYLLDAIRTSAQGVIDLAQFAEIIDGMPAAGMNSAEIISRIAEPDSVGPRTNVFRAITGPATQRSDPGAGVPTFRYLLLSDVRPVWSLHTNVPVELQTAHWTNVVENTYEVRLVFLWPLLPNSANIADASHKQVFRTLISGTWDVTNRLFNVTEFRP